MINKPAGAERESATHAAVGKTLQAAGEARDLATRSVDAAGAGVTYWLIVMMSFGLITSGTPLWFKAIGLAGFYGLFRLHRAIRRRRTAALAARGQARNWSGR
jgi:hypothetical protein